MGRQAAKYLVFLTYIRAGFSSRCVIAGLYGGTEVLSSSRVVAVQHLSQDVIT